MSQFGLPEYDTGIITSDVNLVKLFEHTVEICNSPKDAANWIMGELMKCSMTPAPCQKICRLIPIRSANS